MFQIPEPTIYERSEQLEQLRLEARNKRAKYTGHCPTLKFRIGKRYGANTQEILRERGEKGVLRRFHYRSPDPLQGMLTDERMAPIRRAQDQIRELPTERHRRYILGYTGYIPGLHFRYGTSFRRAADASVDEFARRMSEESSRRALEGPVRARGRSAPKLVSIRGLDQVKPKLDQYCQHNQFQEVHISPEFPPIAGYTGHIPRVKGSEASLSQRYHTAAKRGLTLLRQEQEARRGVGRATRAVQSALDARPLARRLPSLRFEDRLAT